MSRYSLYHSHRPRRCCSALRMTAFGEQQCRKVKASLAVVLGSHKVLSTMRAVSHRSSSSADVASLNRDAAMSTRQHHCSEAVSFGTATDQWDQRSE